MRPIDPGALVIPDGWPARAARALERVRNAADRSTEISRNSSIWTVLNAPLSQLSHGKCWYCETRQIRSDQPVDHFRPKGAVYEVPTHSGYWWLAFDHRNYRFCCTYCNSRRRDVGNSAGGKADRFPIRDENYRALTETDPIAAEDPDLLDPLNPQDPPLLFFENDGRAVPSNTKAMDARKFRRADVSIKIYHLNHTKIKRARKWLFNEIRSLVRDGDIYFSEGPEDPRVQHSRERIVGQLLEHRSEEREYTAAIETYIRGFINPGKRAWLSAVLGA
jgi:uncharacterized protein (TIGR02646 family)